MVIGIHGNVNAILYSRILSLCDIYLSHSWYTKWRLRLGVHKYSLLKGVPKRHYTCYAPLQSVIHKINQCPSIIDVIYQ